MIDAVIFDVDGVLINSNPITYASKAALFRTYGIDLARIPDPNGEAHKGSSLKDLLDRATTQYPHISIDRQQFAAELIARITRDLRASGTTADKDLVRLLDDLHTRHIPCGIASAGLGAGVRNKLAVLGIADYFSVIISADEVAEHKPHPASYVAAMKQLGARPAHTIIFEDSRAGVAAGIAAGAIVLGFSGFSETTEPLEGTTRTINNWREISYAQLAALVPDK